MKIKRYLFSVVSLLAVFFTSCVHNEGVDVIWTLFLQESDIVTVDYPVTVFGCGGHAVFSNKKVDFETVEVKGDTMIEGWNTAVNGVDFTNIEVHVTRQTHHNAVRILFVQDISLPWNIRSEIKHGHNQHVLDRTQHLYTS